MERGMTQFKHGELSEVGSNGELFWTYYGPYGGDALSSPKPTTVSDAIQRLGEAGWEMVAAVREEKRKTYFFKCAR